MQNHYIEMMKFIAQDHQRSRFTWRSDESKDLAGRITRGEPLTSNEFLTAYDKCMNKTGKSELKDNLKFIDPEVRTLVLTPPKPS